MGIKAWHFLKEDRKLRWGTQEEVVAGKTYHHDGEILMCKSGLHASVRPLDALHYSPGPVVCRVMVGGEIIEGEDKVVCTERKVLWMYDATNVLRHFARLCALDVVHLWDAPDVVVRYLKTGDEELRAAAWHAAWDAAWDAAWAAAGDAQNKRLGRMLTEGRRNEEWEKS